MSAQRESPKVGVGIVGWGNVARTLHAPCLTEMDEFEFLASCDPDPAQLAHARETHGCAVYQDLGAFLQHPGLELVVNATPNHMHGPLSIAALESGKHAIVEKPMCTSMQEADSMRAGHSFVVMCERGDIRTWTQENGKRCLWLKSDDGTAERQTVPADPPLHIHSRPFYRNVYEAIRLGSPVLVDPKLSRKYVAIAEAIARSSETRECAVVP